MDHSFLIAYFPSHFCSPSPPALTTADYFAGKRVVLFGLPGAFTPTCSSTHLPGYDAVYNEIKALGVDDVYCLSVNDVRRSMCSTPCMYCT